MITVHFKTDLGVEVSVQVIDERQLPEVQRKYGALGWTSGELPAGGFQLPFDNERDFDWSLIGAREWTHPEKGPGVFYRDSFYTRRELEAVATKKLTLPRAVKYSRGARPTDPENIREKADGEIEYVTLAFFRGGKRQERYAKQGSKAVPESVAPTVLQQVIKLAADQGKIGRIIGHYKVDSINQLDDGVLQTVLSQLQRVA